MQENNNLLLRHNIKKLQNKKNKKNKKLFVFLYREFAGGEKDLGYKQ